MPGRQSAIGLWQLTYRRHEGEGHARAGGRLHGERRGWELLSRGARVGSKARHEGDVGTIKKAVVMCHKRDREKGWRVNGVVVRKAVQRVTADGSCGSTTSPRALRCSV